MERLLKRNTSRVRQCDIAMGVSLKSRDVFASFMMYDIISTIDAKSYNKALTSRYS